MSIENNSDELISSFNNRIQNSLHRHGVFTTEQLLQKSKIDLLEFSNIGLVSVDEIIAALKKRGLSLREAPEQTTKIYIQKPKTKKQIFKTFLKQIFS